MKHLLLPASLFFILGCTQYETEYALNCRFPPAYFNSGKRILLVTDAGGNILHEMEVPLESTGITQPFTLDGKGFSDHYDLHLLEFRDSSHNNISVLSHFDIPNGASVYISPEAANGMFVNNMFLRIEGLESFDSLAVVGDFHVPAPDFDPAQKSVTTLAFRSAGHGIVIRLKANGVEELRQLYLPADSIVTGDTTVVHWQDFKPENNLQTVELPGNVQPYTMLVTAISSDYKSFTTLQELGLRQSIDPGSTLQFNIPEGLEQPSAYRIQIDGSTASYEKIFQPGETLRFDPVDMSIGYFSLTDKNVEVTVNGNADQVHVERATIQWTANGYISWSMDGAPESFKNHALPDLSAYLPGWYYVSSSTVSFTKAGAFQFDKIDYPQLREGFPYKSTEPYARARSGYKAVWKNQ